MEEETLELKLPAVPEFVSTARLFAAAAGRQFGLEEEAVADIKVAISEACTSVIESATPSTGAQPIHVTVRNTGNDMTVEVSSRSGAVPEPGEKWNPATPTDVFQSALGTGVILALFPEAHFDALDGGGSKVSFTVTANSTD